ncbi:hypothetical protein OC846_004970 [Tilletia horrida]|uniref:NADP-dependent oxidoreductase domain-containing protein n=1 Tax=Tilletia horrida TaxID=155126 RepID=A0AAN6GM66_9BASI|nr:hypothetical protein OC846_004970 [Tilletia horrida]KAK0548676.1 hypothetical protein OC845_003465 [Tilletia horrida]
MSSSRVPRLAREIVPNAGFDIPVVAYGAGTALFQKAIEKEVSTALEAGHRFFDLAEMYGNTASAGDGLRPALSSGKVDRKDLTILTKITDGQAQLYKTIQEEIKALNLPPSTGPEAAPFDIVLSHYPPRANKAKGRPSNIEAWRELERALDDGLTRSIGVSNWLADDIEGVYKEGVKHDIAYNQIEFHPLVASTPQYQALLPVCKEKGIKIMCYSALVPLTRNLLPEAPALKEALDKAVAAKPGRTHASVLLKYARQVTGGTIVTTSSKPQRTAEYLSMFAVEGGEESIAGNDDVLSQAEIDAITKAGAQHKECKAWMTE